MLKNVIFQVWLSCADTTDLNDVPFLPVDNTLSTTRNQGRQKLARFSTPELKSLVYDILIDTQRRQMLSEKGNRFGVYFSHYVLFIRLIL